MYYLKLIAQGNKTSAQKVDDCKVLDHLKSLVCLAPQTLKIRSQSRTNTEFGWLPAVDDTEELVYDWKRHGFVVPSNTLDHVSVVLDDVSHRRGVN